MFCTFGVCLNWFLFNYSKISFKKFKVIQNVIWHILKHLFGYFLGYLAKFEVWSGIEKTCDSSYYVITHHKDDYFQWKSNLKIINFELFFEISSILRTKKWFPASAKTLVLILKPLVSVFPEIARNGDPPAWGLLFWTPTWELTGKSSCNFEQYKLPKKQFQNSFWSTWMSYDSEHVPWYVSCDEK